FLALLLASSPAHAVVHITRDHGGYVGEYKVKYKRIRDTGGRVVIDGICNSACTLVLRLAPMHKIFVTPRASLGLPPARHEQASASTRRTTTRPLPSA